MRQAHWDDLRCKTEVSLDEFIKIFVPELPEGLEVTSDFAEQITNTRAWNNFISPSRDEGNEDDVFKRLVPSFDNMMVQARNHWGNRCPSQKWFLLTDPTFTPYASESASRFKPDTHMYRKASSKTSSRAKSSFYDMAFPAEFKKCCGNAELIDDMPKVLYSMQHMMAVDAHRRFIFGITIEDTYLRLWYANRSILVSSAPVDIAQEKTLFIQILLSFAFASDVDMGFDPSVELERDDVQGNFYNIAVGDTHYKTVKVLHDLGADYLLSPAARVFKVKRVGDPEDTFYVLKDLWLEEDRKPEHEIYNEIIRDVENLYGDQADIVRRHLFTPIDHAFVKVNGVRENTDVSMMRNKTLVSVEVTRLPTIAVSIPGPEGRSTSFPTPSDKEHKRNPIYHTVRDAHASERTRHRIHYRIVFKECAKPLHKARNLGEVFAVLVDIMKLFHLFHGSGWVHRDISAANVYLYEGRGILGDLEFAKNTADNSQHKLRAGTIDFMSVETMVQKFLFIPHGQRRPDTPFRYNALHDIESTWWLGIWMLYFFQPEGHEESTQSSNLRQVETDGIFPGVLAHTGRLTFLTFQDYLFTCTEGWIAEVFTYAVEILNNVRLSLVDLYTELERTFPNGIPMLLSQANPASGAAFPGGPVIPIHEPVMRWFSEAKNRYRDTKLVPFKMEANESPQM